SAITATAPASSAILACSGVTTSMITPPLSISAIPRLTRAVPTADSEPLVELFEEMVTKCSLVCGLGVLTSILCRAPAPLFGGRIRACRAYPPSADRTHLAPARAVEALEGVGQE